MGWVLNSSMAISPSSSWIRSQRPSSFFLTNGWQLRRALGENLDNSYNARNVGSSFIRARSTSTSPYSTARQGAFNAKDREENIKKFAELMGEVARTIASNGPKGAIRLVQGVDAFISVGGEWLLEQTRRSPSVLGTAGGPQVVSPGPVELRKLFEKLGATYIKLGQFVASTPTLFPAEYVAEFQKCLDKTPAVSYDEIKTIIREELGRPIDEVYDYVDPKPLASASVAQVHAARLKGSLKEVVIKVLKPGVQDILKTDLDFLYLSARILEFLNPQISRTSLVGIVSDIRTSMLEEVDFQKEATNIESFRNYLVAEGLTRQAAAPQVYRHCSSRRILTLERFYGVPLTDLTSISSLVSSPEATLISALNVWFGSLIACETFHADVHAGNLLVLNDGRVGFIDFGIVGRIAPSTWSAIETFLTSLGTGQYKAMAAALVQMGATDMEIDITQFARDLEKVFDAVQDLDSNVLITAAGGPQSATISATLAVDEQQVNALLLDVIRVSEAYGLRFPREFGLLLKQLLYFDRYTRLLAPNLNVLKDDRISLGSS